MSKIADKLETIPTTPGVYIYKNTQGEVLYVGKAKSLRPRVRSYFQAGAQLEEAKRQMVQKITDIETISTDTETEALILEANLIRQHQPPYNVVLRDDKYYLFIKITKEEFPRVFPVRRLKNDGARYFGPYSSARAVRHTLKLLRRIFPFRGEKDSPHDIIFPHSLFPKANEANEAESYKLNVDHVIDFLKGNRQHLIDTLQRGMREASRSQDFERAQLFRDQLQAIERLEGYQKVYLPRPESFDAISLARSPRQSAANLFQIRQGKLLGKQTFLLKHRHAATPADLLRQFILQYYEVAQDIPKTILIPLELEDSATLTDWIKQRTSQEPAFAVPQRGIKKQIMTMGATNAQQLLDEQEAAFMVQEKAAKAEEELFRAIGASPANTAGNPPGWRVETYDISNIQGTSATASMVVFVGGAPRKDQYRKFKMKLEGQPNDYAMIQETLRRRFARSSSLSGLRVEGHQSDWPVPDLIVIDGGKGQLSAALKVLNEYHLSIPVISLAKREEEIFLVGQPDPVRLPYDSPALQLLQRMRDEAHRFTITYHRLLRSKRSQRSLLDEVPGIGPKTKKQLLNHFGSLKNIRAASDDDLQKIIGSQKTQVLRDYL